MLYRHPETVNAAGHAQDRDEWGEIPGLGAVVPHRANIVVTSGGGYAPASGEGGQPGEGETAVAITFGSTYRPVGRNTSPVTDLRAPLTARGSVKRSLYQSSKQGARVVYGKSASAITQPARTLPATRVWAGGLYGADEFDVSGLGGLWDWARTRLTPPRSKVNITRAALTPVTGGLSLVNYRNVGQWAKARLTLPAKKDPPPEPYVLSNPPPANPEPGKYYPLGEAEGLGGIFDGAGSRLKKAITPPKKTSNIVRAALAVPTVGLSLVNTKSLAKSLPTPVRSAIRYTGAVTQTVFFPILTGGQQRAMFGLDAKESRVFMKGQQISRGVIAAIATAGIVKGAYTPTIFAKTVQASSYGGEGLNIATAPTYSGIGSKGYLASQGYAPSTAFGSGAAPASAAPSLSLGSVTSSPAFMTPTAASLPGYATPAQFAASAAPAASSAAPAASSASLLSKAGGAAGALGKTLGTVALYGAASKLLTPGMGPGLVPGEGSATNVVVEGGSGQPVIIAPPASFGGGGEASQTSTPEPVLAGFSLPMVVLVAGIAVGGGVMFAKRRKGKRRKS